MRDLGGAHSNEDDLFGRIGDGCRSVDFMGRLLGGHGTGEDVDKRVRAARRDTPGVKESMKTAHECAVRK